MRKMDYKCGITQVLFTSFFPHLVSIFIKETMVDRWRIVIRWFQKLLKLSKDCWEGRISL